MNPDQFKQTLSEKGFSLTKRQMEQFDQYYQTLITWNEKMNLTAITDRDEVYLKHFYDSLTPSFYMDMTGEITICDVGAGAGFPSIPLHILFPQLNVTIVDSLKKRITFLNDLAAELQLENITCIHSRAEMFGHEPEKRASFDVVIARAVAPLPVLSELCMPLCKQGGSFMAMKGAKADKEINEAKKALNILGGGVPSIHTFTLPEENSERTLVITEKQQRTPKKYPRKSGTPERKPIM